ncbi:serine hydrolase domain-containing protein [Sediminitomix flava]|uniref:CubicO group peptidase (Beta-lactamase class C family) n=1 Tax=Sediminitomix flava TaxID=379075 RepID=A0A315Z523_SEDFL|nr:serine hydrolase [Sediminitomix flava]PWJ38573.1 CubicO group peptidase (beta-lactamase class C family) [Sediminitomix flava]
MKTQNEQSNKIFLSGITESTTPISKAKNPLSQSRIQEIRDRYSVPNWQSAGDDGVYINLHYPSFNNTDIVMPSCPVKEIERNISADLKHFRFNMKDGSDSQTVDEYVNGDYGRVQALVMAHKGKIVYEAYPGMNPNNFHIWMSTSKTAVGTVCLMLEEDGILDLDKSITDYAKQLKGTAWDKVSVRNALNMASGLDIEETTEAFSDPNSWIEQFFAALMEDQKVGWIEMLRQAKPIDGIAPGEKFQYSTAITQALMLACQDVTDKSWVDLFNEKIYSKIGAQNPFMIGLATDGGAVAGGANLTTPEDMIRYAMLYTSSWNKVADEKVISDELLHKIQTLGQPEAYKGTNEESYSEIWFGEKAERNSAQWDAVFADGAMFKHGNMHQGIYVDPARDFVAMAFATCPNDRDDYTPGFMREAAKICAGK